MEHRPKSLKYYAKKHKILIPAIVIILIIIGAFAFGFRFGPGVSIHRVGTLTLTNIPTGATIYADQVLKGTASATTTAMKFELTRGSHTVIVSVPGDYPWSDLVSIESGKSTVANPILVTETPNATPLTDTDKTTALADIASSALPTLANPLKLAGGALVYVSNNQVIADAATTTPGCVPPPFLCINGSCASTIIFSPATPLSALLKFPGRQDALVLELGNILYAIALDPRAPQFFAPILTGTNPKPGALSDGTIVVQNNTAVYRLKL